MNHFSLSARSVNRLQGVDARLVQVISRAITLTSVDFSVIEGVRTAERQQELFAAGKTRTLNSRHLTGHAVDVMPVGASLDDPEAWLPVLKAIKCAADALHIRLRFGYTWDASPDTPVAKFLDAPHVELDE
jgi:hypothetical protein